ncbi:MAG: lipoate--protein ligase family protein, partial [Promethearchaeota archaeon]
MSGQGKTKFDTKIWRVLPFMIADGPTNMAIDEAILIARTEDLVPNTIRFYRWKPSTASIGSHQSLSDEINLEAAKKLGVDVVRRISGGGAVYHDLKNEITYSVIVDEKTIREIFHRMENKYFGKEDPNEFIKGTITEQVLNRERKEEERKEEERKKSNKGNTTTTNTNNNLANKEPDLNQDRNNIEERAPRKRFFTVSSSYHVITRGLVNGLRELGVVVDQGVIHCPALFINKKKIS